MHEDWIHAWFMPEEKSLTARQETRLLNLLDEQEKNRLARYRQEQDRRLFLQSRALLRTALSRLCGVDPASWRFSADGLGRPTIVEPILSRPLCFSLSHTPGMIGCLAAENLDCGIDVESTGRRSSLEKLARKVLSEEEQAEWTGLDPEEKKRRFYDCWTLKEAYLKAVGVGLAVSLREISFSFGGDPPRLTRALGDSDGGPWSFRLHQPSPVHRAAIAWRGAENRRMELLAHHERLGDLE